VIVEPLMTRRNADSSAIMSYSALPISFALTPIRSIASDIDPKREYRSGAVGVSFAVLYLQRADSPAAKPCFQGDNIDVEFS